MGEKEILHFYVEFTEYAIGILQMKYNDASIEIAKLPKYFDSASEYFTSSILPILLN
jgi:hypothetical protein